MLRSLLAKKTDSQNITFVDEETLEVSWADVVICRAQICGNGISWSEELSGVLRGNIKDRGRKGFIVVFLPLYDGNFWKMIVVQSTESSCNSQIMEPSNREPDEIMVNASERLEEVLEKLLARVVDVPYKRIVHVGKYNSSKKALRNTSKQFQISAQSSGVWIVEYVKVCLEELFESLSSRALDRIARHMEKLKIKAARVALAEELQGTIHEEQLEESSNDILVDGDESSKDENSDQSSASDADIIDRKSNSSYDNDNDSNGGSEGPSDSYSGSGNHKAHKIRRINTNTAGSEYLLKDLDQAGSDDPQSMNYIFRLEFDDGDVDRFSESDSDSGDDDSDAGVSKYSLEVLDEPSSEGDVDMEEESLILDAQLPS